jgi:hypothetical protein
VRHLPRAGIRKLLDLPGPLSGTGRWRVRAVTPPDAHAPHALDGRPWLQLVGDYMFIDVERAAVTSTVADEFQQTGGGRRGCNQVGFGQGLEGPTPGRVPR